MYNCKEIIILGGINHEYETVLFEHVIFICSINHEQWSDDRTLLNMYFNKYVNLHLCRFFLETSEFLNTYTLVFIIPSVYMYMLS